MNVAHDLAPSGASFRDGLDAIAQDHASITSLFSAYEAATEQLVKLQLVRQIVTTVAQHASAEERTLYPLVKQRVPKEEGGQLLYDMMVNDDQVNKELLEYLRSQTPNTPAEWELWGLQVKKFIAIENEHLDKEEREVVGRLSKLLTNDEKDKLWTDFQHALRNASLQPHPAGGSTAVAAKLLHPIAGVVDRATHAAAGMIHKAKGFSSPEQKAAHLGTEAARKATSDTPAA